MAATSRGSTRTGTADSSTTGGAVTSGNAAANELQAQTGLLASDPALDSEPGADADPNPENLSPTAAKKAGAVVRYNGVLSIVHGVRGMTADEWAAAGVEDQDDVYWNDANGYMVPAKSLTAHAIKFLTEVEQGFVLETLD